MTVPITMTAETVTRLIDKCTDGALTATEADALTAALRRDDEGAQWILDELELAGLISEAFSKTTAEDFIRGFTERLSAESDPDTFAVDAQRLIASQSNPPRNAQPGKRLRDAFFMPGRSGVERDRAALVGRFSGARRVALVVLGAVALGLAVWGAMSHARPATLIAASGNVIMLREGDQVPPRPGTRLVVGDRLLVPAAGSAVLSFGKQSVVHVAEHSDAAIAAASPRSADGATVRQLELRQGSATVDVGSIRRRSGLIVSTPHARIEPGASRFTVAVTLSSTRLAVEVGNVILVRGGGGPLTELAAGESTIVGAGDAFGVDDQAMNASSGGEDDDR
jgi:ferric-dicitrate binding protein FerR (iron transport regulator)